MPCNTILVNPYPYILIAPVRVDFIPPSTTPGFFPLSLHTRDLCGLGALGAGGGTGAETVGELAVDGLEVTHAAGAGGLPALGLLAPVDCAALVSRRLGGWDVCLFCSSRAAREITYTSWSWQQGSRKRSRCASGCGGSDDLRFPLAEFSVRHFARLQNPSTVSQSRYYG